MRGRWSIYSLPVETLGFERIGVEGKDGERDESRTSKVRSFESIRERTFHGKKVVCVFWTSFLIPSSTKNRRLSSNVVSHPHTFCPRKKIVNGVIGTRLVFKGRDSTRDYYYTPSRKIFHHLAIRVGV